jgi:hypothetical protein
VKEAKQVITDPVSYSYTEVWTSPHENVGVWTGLFPREMSYCTTLELGLLKKSSNGHSKEMRSSLRCPRLVSFHSSLVAQHSPSTGCQTSTQCVMSHTLCPWILMSF